MIVFESGLDRRTRECDRPQVAKFHMGNGAYRYCIIGTQYGHIHTTGGNVRTWATANGARRFLRSYTPL